jgi:hypothetical protein
LGALFERDRRSCDVDATDQQTKNAWANDTDATEQGAYGMALAALEVSSGLFAVRRAETRTGADYYLASIDDTSQDLESWWRLEVSGTDKGTGTMVYSRVQQKLEQAQAGSSNLPALVAVVGFEVKLIAVDILMEV